MAERDELVSALFAEVLGPRGGVRECLQAPPHRTGQSCSPLEEYITGVLVPRNAHTPPEIDASDNLLGEADESADDQASAGAVEVGASPAGGTGFSPPLDPRMRPCSIGLSILVNSDTPTIDICTTWAWYEASDNQTWQREPRHDVWTSVDCTQKRSTKDISEPDAIRGVTLETRCRPNPDGRGTMVSIFLVNSTTTEQTRAEHHVYQPQIRIRTGEGTRLLPLEDENITGDKEEASLALLYSNRRARARGHLCAAVWKDIDPEQSFSGTQPQAPPFVWSDGKLLPPGKMARFTSPCARTELVPCYLIQAPLLNAASTHGSAEFNPQELSEASSPSTITKALVPLADAYEAWIDNQAQQTTRLQQQHHATAGLHIQQCRTLLRRIRDGIDLLSTDDDARLAFCFANKAIALQSLWTQKEVNPWRPFQLAFILTNLISIRQEQSPDRAICDLLWVPTGGGKTEAYLGLAAFTFSLRRLLAKRKGDPNGGGGVTMLSRYTLRLLTIQQFRRALGLVTACELLRNQKVNGVKGWRPSGSPETADAIWGHTKFSIGLWVGRSVTPNGLFDFKIPTPPYSVPGALSILKGNANGAGDGEPAQVLKCPACTSTLAVPPEGYPQGTQTTLHLVLECQSPNPSISPVDLSGPMRATGSGQTQSPLLNVTTTQLNKHTDPVFHTLSITFSPSRDVSPKNIDDWVSDHVLPAIGQRPRLVCAQAVRPGYFLRPAQFQGGRINDVDFEIFCPNPECELNTGDPWSEATPKGRAFVQPAFRSESGESSRTPVPAMTVDDQIYHRCPTIVISTVDKYARLAFEPRAAGMFGFVDHYCDRHGFYRAGCPPTLRLSLNQSDHPQGVTPKPVSQFRPPELILQDELHLIDGPLGSMVGIYETAIEALTRRTFMSVSVRPKYIASSATVRQAEDQVQSLYDRTLSQFPPPGISIEDNFFSTSTEAHALDNESPGRLYVGICAPGRGAQTPIVRIWSRLLQHVEQRQLKASLDDLDGFWTLVGYFNAIRELAGAVALARQDIPERMAFISLKPRRLTEDDLLELSSRASSLELPGMLERLETRLGSKNPIGAVVSTSMFGTGVDVSRLGLMVVHGQPKTSSSYIQATGRVGRKSGGLVVSFYKASRPRDLSHYEFFMGYHRELYRHVEPVTVNPFSPRARDKALGPVAVALLRQASEVPTASISTPVQGDWRIQQRSRQGWHCRASDMAGAQKSAEIIATASLMESRASTQPSARRPQSNTVSRETASEIDRWAQLASLAGSRLLYNESSMIKIPKHMVVLGDLAHEVQGLSVAFENAPNSLREVEATTTFKGRS